MKHTIINAIIALLFSLSLLNSQEQLNHWLCVTDSSDLNNEFGPLGPSTVPFVVVYLDFPDGRLNNGQVPTTDAELNSVDNLDAVCNMGFIRDENGNYVRKVRKYTYEHCWNKFFSLNTYIDGSHPDWESHGAFNNPPIDPAKGYGSIKDYFTEISYGKLNVSPFVTHINETGIYKTGIVNNFVDGGNGIKYIDPIMLSQIKSEYYGDYGAIIYEAHQILQTMYPTQIEFNINEFINNYNGKIIYIFAGGTPDNVGGVAVSNECTIREKRVMNNYEEPQANYLKVIDGISVAAHEFGHLLGWPEVYDGNIDHSLLGNYCIMGKGSEKQNCPPHPNIVLKLQMKWINNSKIIKLRTPQQITDLKPSEFEGDCAILTIYGKPWYEDLYNYSEFYAIENRRMLDTSAIKFDKEIVWRDNKKPQIGFTGGCLIYRYNLIDKSFKLISANPNIPFDDEGHSDHFWGVNTLTGVHTQLSESRTQSSMGLNTGISISNINGSSGNISFNNFYSLGVPPDYDQCILFGGYPSEVYLTGNVFVYNSQFTNNHPYFNLNIAPGTTVDFANNGLNNISNSNIIANGTAENRIVFRGCGFDQNRLYFNGIRLSSRPQSAYSPITIIKNCDFHNVFVAPQYNGIIINTNFQSNTTPIIIENNNFYYDSPEIRIYAGTSYCTIQSIVNNSANIFLKSNLIAPFKITGNIVTHGNWSINFLKQDDIEAKYLFSNTSIINSNYINAVGYQGNKIYFDKLPEQNQWQGINVFSGIGNFSFCDFKNTVCALGFNSSSNFNVNNCVFNNNNYDICAGSSPSKFIKNITNNQFNCTSANIASLYIGGTNNVNIEDNTFTNVNEAAVYQEYCLGNTLKENQFYASNTAAAPIGIFSYSSDGNIICNSITNFSNGILLDNSSPKLYNNTIWNNGYGIYLTNGSNPILSPSYSNNQTLKDAGYNLIYNNLNEEIYCYNDYIIPISQPLLYNGYNSIYDNIFPGYLVNTNFNPNQQPVNAENNYWEGDPTGKFNPEYSVLYDPYLSVMPAPVPCDEYIEIADNTSMQQEYLLLGSASIDDYNENYTQSIQKYNQYINNYNDSMKVSLPASWIYYITNKLDNPNYSLLENYFNDLSLLYNNSSTGKFMANLSTYTDVIQTEYVEAINEYDYIINTSQNPLEIYYANINKYRVFLIAGDSILGNGLIGNGINGNGINDFQFQNYLTNISNQNKIISKNSDLINTKRIIDNYYHESVNNLINDNPGNKNTHDVSYIFDEDKIKINDLKIQDKQKLINDIFSSASMDDVKTGLLKELFGLAINSYISDSRPTTRIEPLRRDLSLESLNNTPKEYKLNQNYPNPFNPVTTIKYSLPKDGKVSILIYDITGKLLKTLIDEYKQAGTYEVRFDGSHLASGVYFYKMISESFVESKKMILVK